VAQALVHKPPVIVLDEHTAGVDVELRQGLWQFIRRLNSDGHTIVLTTHYLEEAEALCGRIAMLKSGRVVALDSMHNLLNRFQHHVHLRVRITGAALTPQLAALVHHVDERGHVLKLKGFDEVEPRLAELRAAGCHIEEMEVAPPDLEDVFVEIMQRENTAAKAAP
jgi:ABC-2 type transport system ATP-binding protein